MKKNLFLVVPIVLIILFLLGVSYYKFFIYDKKGNNNPISENLDVNDLVVQKYYDYVKVANYNESILIDPNEYYNVNAINNNKTLFGYLLTLRNDGITSFIYGDGNKECRSFVKEIREKYEDKFVCGTPCINGCYTDDTKEEYWKNNDDKLTYVVEEEKIKNAVEQIFGKNTYTQSDFDILNSSIKMMYFENEKSYVLITVAQGSPVKRTIWLADSNVSNAKKINNELIIYEELTLSLEEENKGMKIIIKHTFEKNTYDDEYHYIKSDIESKENVDINIEESK